MSALRARCPDCHTLTAVAVGTEYQCHSCGREFAAGLVRVPRAWGEGGDAMAARRLARLPYPEAAVVEEPTLDAQIAAQDATCRRRLSSSEAAAAPTRGGRAASGPRAGRLAVVWLDAHGDLNTPESSPVRQLAGGCRCAMCIDEGFVRPSRRRPRRRPQSRSSRARLPSRPPGSTTMSTARSGMRPGVRGARLRRPPTGSSSRSSCPSREGLTLEETESLLGRSCPVLPRSRPRVHGTAPATRTRSLVARLAAAAGL